MFYSIKVPNGLLPDAAKYKLYRIAREYIAFYNMTANDLTVEKHIKEIKKIDLKTVCYQLIKNLKFSFDGACMIVKFKDKADEDLARLITYGDGTIKGSNILRDIFKGKGN